MADPHPTRATLLLRVRDARDVRAWSEFVELYAPLVYRYARRHGLQDADAADLTQEVLRSVAGAMPDFEYDPRRGRFRTWLYRIAQNRLINWRSSAQRRIRGSGDTAVHALLDARPAADHDEDVWEREYRQRLFAWAAERVRGRFQESTWQAFHQTAVEGRDPAEVATSLGLSTGAVYIARSRVLARLKQEIEQQLGECPD